MNGDGLHLYFDTPSNTYKITHRHTWWIDWERLYTGELKQKSLQSKDNRIVIEINPYISAYWAQNLSSLFTSVVLFYHFKSRWRATKRIFISIFM